MAAQRTALISVTALGLVAGMALASLRPQWPILGYWLVFSIAIGAAISFSSALQGFAERTRWLLTADALIVAVALATTQIAARTAISATHLQYRGVHVVGVDSFTVGAGETDADIHLQTVATAEPWSIRVVRKGASWAIEPLSGIEQLRVIVGRTSSRREFSVARSAILTSSGDWAEVVDPSGAVADTLRLVDGRIESARSNAFLLRPIDSDIEARYRRQLRAGALLSELDGVRHSPALYERFVRVQELSPSDIVNGMRPSPVRWIASSIPLAGDRWLGGRSILVGASPPFRLRSPTATDGQLAFTDSALVEVRDGGVSWQFQLRTWRREPSAPAGLALLFVRNPRALDTPLPAGTSCVDGVACGAISLRRLPPPVPHVSLDLAGFDPARFGMLGTIHQDENGYAVVLPRQTYRVDLAAPRPVALPVTAFSALTSRTQVASDRSPFWVLLAASGTYGDDAWRILGIAVGLALLLAAIHTGVAASMRDPSRISAVDERVLCLGISTILTLLLARLIIGARVAFFAPFLQRSIETAVGMWVAIAIVSGGLLSWRAWLPPLLTGARNLLAGCVAFRRAAREVARLPITIASLRPSTGGKVAGFFVAAALVTLLWAVPAAVINGVVAGIVVLLAWVCLAWVAAFSSRYFESFERGAWSVVEQLAPHDRIASSSESAAPHGIQGTFGRWCARVPELPIIVACFLIEAELIPGLATIAAAATILFLLSALFVIPRRRRLGAVNRAPDYWAAAIGTGVFGLVLAILRSRSESGSMAAFVLIVFVALASVRIGRSVGVRIEAARQRAVGAGTSASEVLISSLLLIAPLGLLAPLMAIDMGLFLVIVVPVGFATLLAAGGRGAGRRLVIPGLAFLSLFFLLAPTVLFPSVKAIRAGESHAAKAAAFERMTKVLGVRLPVVSTSLDRAAARSVATEDRKLAEELLISAKPGPARDLLIPSIEQIWGGTTYATAGFFGQGLGQAVVGGRGVAEPVSYAENTYSVFVLAEHGAFGGLLVLSLYLLLTAAVGWSAMTGPKETVASYRASRALFLVAALIIAIPAVYVALSNLGVVPITGQNMPFLGLNAWSDVAICAGVVGILITGTIRRMTEPAQ